MWTVIKEKAAEWGGGGFPFSAKDIVAALGTALRALSVGTQEMLFLGGRASIHLLRMGFSSLFLVWRVHQQCSGISPGSVFRDHC